VAAPPTPLVLAAAPVVVGPALVVLVDVTFAVPLVVLLLLEVFAAFVAFVVCVVPFDVVPFDVVAAVPEVTVFPLVVVLPAVGVPSVPVSLLAGSLPQWTKRTREVSETKQREEVRLSIAVLKGKRTESHECRLSKLIATLGRSNSCQEERSGWHRQTPDRKPVASRRRV